MKGNSQEGPSNEFEASSSNEKIMSRAKARKKSRWLF